MDGGMALRAAPFFAGLEWGALATRHVPPPFEPTLLGDADTRNFWHASMDESDAATIGAGLTATSPDRERATAGVGCKRARHDRASWEGF